MPNDSKNNHIYGEGQKLLVELFKHLTTLSTFSTLLMAIFLKDVFENPTHKSLVSWSFGSFVLSILFSVFVMFILAHSFINGSKIAKPVEWIGIVLVTLSIAAFVAGIFSLSVFSIKNF